MEKPTTPDLAQAHEALLVQVKAVLAGQPPEIQSTVLAECVALWLAGHIDVKGDKRWLAEFRMHLLVDFEELVSDLLPICEKQLDETIVERRREIMKAMRERREAAATRRRRK